MVKGASFILAFAFSLNAFSGASPLDCQTSSAFEQNLNELTEVTSKVDDCPKPTEDQFLDVCNSIWNTSHASTPGFGYTYQEKMWLISCANPGKDSIEQARVKIQNMWNQYREEFRCKNFINSIATGKNITKFSLENGLPGFITEAVKRYKLDMNFKDPDDQKTIMDYIKDRQEEMRNRPPVDQAKIDEYERIYQLLKTNGAKHSKDL